MDINEIYSIENKHMKIPKVLLSSTGSGNVSLTVKGLAVMAIVWFLNSKGYVVDQGVIVDVVNALAILASTAMTLYGLVRKFK